jgi:hypothetical protein
LSAKLVPTLAERGVSRSQCGGSLRPYSRFSRQKQLLFYQVAPLLYSRGWVESVPDPIFLRKSGSAGNWTRTSGSVARPLDHRGGHFNVDALSTVGICDTDGLLGYTRITRTKMIGVWI